VDVVAVTMAAEVRRGWGGRLKTQNVKHWQRSSYCTTGACVEVAFVGNMVAVRDSKNPNLPPIWLTRAEWYDFKQLSEEIELDRF